MAKLSVAQQAVLEEVKVADERLRLVKRNAKAQIEIEINRAISDVEAVRNAAVLRALEMKVPKTRIREYGMGTTNPYALDKIMKTSESLAGLYAESSTFMWLLRADGQVRVNWPNYADPTDIWDGSLKGVIQLAPTTRSGWAALTDESDQKTPEQNGLPAFTLPGELRVATENGLEPFYSALTEWYEANK